MRFMAELMRRIAKRLFRGRREREAIYQYVRSYREMPETEEEIEAADRASSILLAQSPWDEQETKKV